LTKVQKEVTREVTDLVKECEYFLIHILYKEL